MKKKDRKSTIMGIVAGAMFLISSPDSPVKDMIPQSVKTYTVLGGGIALGILGKVAADASEE